MSKLTGYHVTVKLFVPSPKNDFAAQAKAAQMMHDLTTTGTIGPELLAIGRVVNVTGKYGTFDDGALPPTLPEIPPPSESGLTAASPAPSR